MIRIAIVGYGIIGKRHADIVRAHPACSLAAVIDPVPDQVGDIAEPVFASIHTVDVPVDAAIVATPSDLHADHAVACAARGWHMIVEKPVAHSLEAGAQIVAAFKAAGVHTLVGHHRRHHKNMVTLKNILDSGAIGAPVSATLMWLMKKPDPYFDVPWRSGDGGSPVTMNLVHDIDLLRYLLGDVIDVTALHGKSLRGADRNENGVVALRFDSGATATIAFADVTPSPWGFETATSESPAIPATRQDMLFIAGTAGAVSYPSLTVWTGAADWTEKPDADQHGTDDTIPFRAQLDHFLELLAGKVPPRVDVAEGLETLRVTLEAEALLARHRRAL